MLLDDPSPLVRRALAEVFASAQKAPPVVVHALAADQPDVALPMLARSPLLLEDDLVDLIATGHPEAQVAIAGRRCCRVRSPRRSPKSGRRKPVSRSWKIPTPTSRRSRIDRIVERFGHLAPIRENLMARDDLPMATRQALLASCRRRSPVSSPRANGWGRSTPNTRRARPAKRQPSRSPPRRLTTKSATLVQHLRQSGQLTAGMILRALLSGNVVLFEEALAELSGVPLDRVTATSTTRISPASARSTARPDCRMSPIRRSAKRSRRCAKALLVGEQGGVARLKRRMVERVLALAPRERGEETWPRCWRCCGALRSRPRARKPACSATIWSPADRGDADDLPMPAGAYQSTKRTPDEPASASRPADSELTGVYRGRARIRRDAARGRIAGDLLRHDRRAMICSSTSGRSRFSCIRNSSVTSRSRLVSVVARSSASERAYSR